MRAICPRTNLQSQCLSSSDESSCCSSRQPTPLRRTMPCLPALVTSVPPPSPLSFSSLRSLPNTRCQCLSSSLSSNFRVFSRPKVQDCSPKGMANFAAFQRASLNDNPRRSGLYCASSRANWRGCGVFQKWQETTSPNQFRCEHDRVSSLDLGRTMLRVSLGALLLAGSASAFAPMPSTRLGLRAPAASALSMAVQDVTDAAQLDSIVKEAGLPGTPSHRALAPPAAPETERSRAHLGTADA